MKINYKFNKSSESLTCKVESIDLIVYQIESQDITPENCREAIPLIRIFYTSQELKDYISQYQQEIEFIGSSSLDDVLLKDWLGEWETTDKILNNFTMLQLAPTIKAVHHSTASVIELFKETRDNPYGELEKSSFWLNYKEFDDLFNSQVKTGSPKLNTNWKFKIK